MKTRIDPRSGSIVEIGNLCSWGDDDPPPTATTTTSNTPWQSSALQKGIDSAGVVLDTPKQYFQGQTYADFDPATVAGMQGTLSRAQAPSQIINGVQQSQANTLNGTYLAGGNPAYQQMVDRAVNPLTQQFQNVVMPGINSQFSAGGRSNSGIAKSAALNQAGDNYMRQVGDVAGNLAYQNYGAERQNMMNAAQIAPQTEQLGYMPYQMMGQVGAANEAQQTASIQDQINRFNFGQNEEANRIGQYMGLVGGGYGGTSTQSAPVQQSNPWLQGLGAASTGVGIASGLFGPQGGGGLFPGGWWGK